MTAVPIMSAVPTPASDVAFTPSVKAAQLRKGSREAYQRMEERGVVADDDHARSRRIHRVADKLLLRDGKR